MYKSMTGSPWEEVHTSANGLGCFCGSHNLAVIMATSSSGISGAIPIKIFSLVIIVKIHESVLCASHCAGWLLFCCSVFSMRNSCYSYFIDEEINA